MGDGLQHVDMGQQIISQKIRQAGVGCGGSQVRRSSQLASFEDVLVHLALLRTLLQIRYRAAWVFIDETHSPSSSFIETSRWSPEWGVDIVPDIHE